MDSNYASTTTMLFNGSPLCISQARFPEARLVAWDANVKAMAQSFQIPLFMAGSSDWERCH